MKPLYILKAFSVLLLLAASLAATAQTRLTGRVTDAVTGDGLAGVSVAVLGTVTGTITDARGHYSLQTNTRPPFRLRVSSVGYLTQEVDVSDSRTDLNFILSERTTLGEEVVVSASRVEESVMKSPVSIEKMDIRTIQQTPAPDFYGGLANMKGIDVSTQSLTFRSLNMRGFGANGNLRVSQLIDGMDNQAPGLNFAVDNIVGMPELDVESVEILPGAASALYGPNALNGIVLMNSKSPFLYQGLSVAAKGGVMSAANRDKAVTPYTDLSFRWAKALSNKLAVKINGSWLQAKDWAATNYGNLNNDYTTNPTGGGNPDPMRATGTSLSYDGVNVYGDEANADLQSVAQALINAKVLPATAAALFPSSVFVSRTGYNEKDLVNYNVGSIKANGALHYRFSEKVEGIAQVNYGYGTTVYTGNSRYALRNFNVTQAKLELKGDNFNLRAYTTQERSGNSYAVGLQAIQMNEAWKPSTTWFAQYTGAYATARAAGQTDAQAHAAARAAADQGRPLPGTEAFESLRKQKADETIASGTGSGFLEKSNLYHLEGSYNFKNQIRFVDVLAGANYRVFQLRSFKTLFADNGGTILIPEYGGFLQIAKSLGPLRLTASGRYDKNKNFEGRFTPRVAAVLTLAGQNNIRASYQTGFRIPTTQDQYIDLVTPQARLLGGLPGLRAPYGLESTASPAYSLSAFQAAGAYVKGKAADPAFQQAAINQLKTLVTAQVTSPAGLAQIQAAVLPLVTQQVTSAVQAQVGAGNIPNNPAAIQAAITQGVTQALPAAIQAAATKTITDQVTANATNFVTLAAIRAGIGAGMFTPHRFSSFKTEKVATWEIGYKGLIGNRLMVDAYYYQSRYTDMIVPQVYLQAKTATDSLPARFAQIAGGTNTRNVYALPVNASQPVLVRGWALGLNYGLKGGYSIGANWAVNEMTQFTPDTPDQYAGFNSPRNRYNVSVGKQVRPGSNWGFSVNFRHQDAFRWESSFVRPTLTTVPYFTNTTVPANRIVDAQFSFRMPVQKTTFKVGGTNIFNTPYVQAYGNPTIGAMYYVGVTFDQLSN